MYLALIVKQVGVNYLFMTKMLIAWSNKQGIIYGAIKVSYV